MSKLKFDSAITDSIKTAAAASIADILPNCIK